MKRIVFVSFITLVSLIPILLPSQISASSTPTPTPPISEEYLEITDLEEMKISHTRTDSTYGAIFLFSDLSGTVPAWGLIYDNENTFYDMYTGWGQVRLRSIILSGYSTQAGDNILLTYDGNQKKRVYLPEMTGYKELYVSLEGSTYYDQWLSQTAQEALPPTRTPTATPSPSPTPEGYHTPSPSPTPTLTPGGYRTPTPIVSPTTTPVCYCCPDFYGDSVTLTDHAPALCTYWHYYADPCVGIDQLTWWTSGTAAWVEVLPEQGPGWNNYKIFVALGDTSPLPPGSHQAMISFQDNFCGFAGDVYVSYTKPTPIQTATQTPTPIPPSPPTPSPTATGCAVCDVTVKGYVKDSIDLSPIGDALVEVHGLYISQATTDDSGYYSAIALTCWGYFPIEISVSANGYYSQSIWEDLDCYNTYYYDFNMIPKPPVFCDGGDYDGDGTADIGIFRPLTGLWAIRGLSRVYFGADGDIPVSGDYTGNNTTDIGIFRGSTGLWAIRGLSRFYYGSLDDQPIPADYDGDGTVDGGIFRETASLWAIRGITRVWLGGTGDIPVPADYNNDNSTDIAFFRPLTGLWLIRNITRTYFGRLYDLPVQNDYDGDNICDLGIFRGSSGLWAIRGVTRGYYGSLVDEPVPADYNGNKSTDIGLFRDSSGLWAIKGVSRVYFGSTGDLPVTR